MQRTEIAHIGLGANVGASQRSLEAALAALASLPGATLLGVSRLYRTRPVGGVVQADFLNAVGELRVPAGPEPATGAMALLVALKGIERAMGRQERERWGPRELDLDLLLFGPHRVLVVRDPEARSDDPARSGSQWLEVPHPAAEDRLFVLAPLAELVPDLEPPGWGRSVAAARDAARAREGREAVRAVATWHPKGRCWIPVDED